MKDLILGSYRIPEDHIHIVPNAIETAEYNPQRRAELREEMRVAWGIPPEAVCLLFLGHNFRRKGLWQLLEALPERRRDRPTGPRDRGRPAARVIDSATGPRPS